MKPKNKKLVYGVGVNDADYAVKKQETIGYVDGKPAVCSSSRVRRTRHNGEVAMKDYRNNQYPEHDRTSCSDENIANAVPDGSGCRRCNALLFNRYEELLEEVQALHVLRKDAERYRYIKQGNRWIVATTQTGVQIAGEELDDLIDNEME